MRAFSIRLQSQPAQVLACLILRAGQTVSREELRKAVWGVDTFVDRGLNFCIGQIRLALDDDSTTPRYIRTLRNEDINSSRPSNGLNMSAAIPASPTAAPPS